MYAALVSLLSVLATAQAARGLLAGPAFLAQRSVEHRTETLLSLGGVVASETLLARYGRQAPYTRQLTDGRTYVQLIYSQVGVLSDCDVIHKDRKHATALAERATGDLSAEGYTVRALGGPEELEEQWRGLLDIRGLRRACRRLHRRQEQAMGQLHKMRSSQGEEFLVPESLMETRQEPAVDESTGRSRRAVYFSDMIYPGTLWCGKGNVSSSFEELGEARETDKCCRTHDHCEFVIEGFQTRYELFNYRFTTLSHCICDERSVGAGYGFGSAISRGR